MSILIAYFVIYVMASAMFIINDQHQKKTGTAYFKPVKLSTCVIAFIVCIILFVILGIYGMQTM